MLLLTINWNHSKYSGKFSTGSCLDRQQNPISTKVVFDIFIRLEIQISLWRVFWCTSKTIPTRKFVEKKLPSPPKSDMCMTMQAKDNSACLSKKCKNTPQTYEIVMLHVIMQLDNNVPGPSERLPVFDDYENGLMKTTVKTHILSLTWNRLYENVSDSFFNNSLHNTYV